MNTTVGVREFRRDLAEFIDQSDLATITRHGQAVGLFIPVHRDRGTYIAAYAEVAQKASALLTEWGLPEDEAVAEFDALRRAERDTKLNA